MSKTEMNKKMKEFESFETHSMNDREKMEDLYFKVNGSQVSSLFDIPFKAYGHFQQVDEYTVTLKGQCLIVLEHGLAVLFDPDQQTATIYLPPTEMIVEPENPLNGIPVAQWVNDITHPSIREHAQWLVDNGKNYDLFCAVALYCRYRKCDYVEELTEARKKGVKHPKWDAPYQWLQNIPEKTLSDIVDMFYIDCSMWSDPESFVPPKESPEEAYVSWLEIREHFEAFVQFMKHRSLDKAKQLEQSLKSEDRFIKDTIMSFPKLNDNEFFQRVREVDPKAWWGQIPIAPRASLMDSTLEA